MADPVKIICLKWGTKYPAEYVNRLYRMVNKHLTIPFEFYCITENTEGLYPEINVLDLILEEGLKGWWYKLQLFKQDFYGLSGQAMFLDLDVVITANINSLFDINPDDFVIIKDLQAGKVYNSSVFKLKLGTQTHVWDSFLADKESIISRMHGDQDWISESVNNAKLWPKDWVVSFKKSVTPVTKILGEHWDDSYALKVFAYLRGHAQPPADAKIVYFHGKPDPDDVVDGPFDMWKQAPWIRDEWKG